MDDEGGKLISLILTILVILIAPAISLAAINQVFSTNIEMTIGTYLALIWLHIVVS